MSTINPFFLSSSRSQLENLEKFDSIYILCQKKKNSEISKFFNKNTPLSDLFDFIPFITTLQAPLAVLPQLKKGLILVSNENLQPFIPNPISSSNDFQLVYLMLETREEIVSDWINTHAEKGIDMFIKQKIFSDFYKLDNQLILYLKQVPEFKYWDSELNCDIGAGSFKAVSTLSHSDITELLVGSSLSEKEKYYLLCGIISSKDYSHYVLNNLPVLEASKDIFQKYLPIFRYLIGYSWAYYLKQESKQFDIETVSKLPVFPFCGDFPYLNPYYSNKLGSTYPIINLSEFKQKLNIMIGGDLLNGINWHNMKIKGETIQKASNIVIQCTESNIFDWIEDIKHWQQVIKNNLQTLYPNDHSIVHIVPNKTLCIHINEQILKEKPLPYTYDYITKNLDKYKILYFFYNLYLQERVIPTNFNISLLEDKIDEKLFFEIVNPVKMDNITIIIDNNVEISPVSDQIQNIFYSKSDDHIFIKFTEILKYNIEYLNYQIEFSREEIPYGSYYDGTNYYLSPLDVSAIMTSKSENLMDFYEKFYPKCPKEFITYQTIESDGKLSPRKEWMVDAIYDLLKN